MSINNDGVDVPVARVALGLRFEFCGEAPLREHDCKLIGALSREDLHGAAVPRVGDRLGPGMFPLEFEQGLAGTVHHVDHYLQVPGVCDRPPLSYVIVRVHGVDFETFGEKADLAGQDWHISDLRSYRERRS